jgi:metal-dependent amidase/aminoacylase/carboxypeptidase family protein
MNNVAKGAALMAGVAYEIKLNNGLYELLTNETGAKTLQNNMNIVGPITYTPEELALLHERKWYGSKRHKWSHKTTGSKEKILQAVQLM